MQQIIVVVLIGALTVIVFDTLASLISLHFQIKYSFFAIGSFVIYAGVGYVAAKSSYLIPALVAVALVALVDSTIGWYISWIIGPGNPGVEMSSAEIFATIIFSTAMAIPFGLLGGLFNRLLRHQIS